jgi:gamma-glutamyltranspeptidase/glutathione hydrolase
MTAAKGAIAAGHEMTAEAAATVLAAGGNAFDAAVSACFAACVAEPVLASLGGGGFLLAKPVAQPALVYDFFAQTPHRPRRPQETELYPISVDFGDATQEFHIGMGSIATPGAIAGMFAVQRELCRMPMRELITPASEFARDGLVLTPFQYRLARIVEPILRASEAAFAPHASPQAPERLAEPGETLRQPDLADSLEALSEEGEDIFYRGAWGERLIADCAAGGGHLVEEDLAAYRVVRRKPLSTAYRGESILINPSPALGGPLILFALRLLDQIDLRAHRRGSASHIHALATAMDLTQRLRREGATETDPGSDPLAARLIDTMRKHPLFPRGTTQISIADAEGNLASLTLSNGEGAGYVLPGTGIVLNNMLGEEDINPQGFHRWPQDRRLSSMMSPTLLARPDGSWVVTGSSGSNRIRSAILQVVVNLVDFGLPLSEAVAAPRIHFEDDLLNLEPPVDDDTLSALATHWPKLRRWNQLSVFFGGAHSVLRTASHVLEGAADPRRGGAVRLV